MLSLEHQDLIDEVNAALAWRKRHLADMGDQVRNYHGGSYLDDAGHGNSGNSTENYAFSYISLVLPRLAHDVPRMQVESRGEEGSEDTAKTIESAINAWAGRSHLRRTVERIAVDMLFTWGAAVVTPEPVASLRRVEPSHGGKLPRVYRVAPDRLVVDPAATDLSDARYIGHQYVCDHDDLVDRAEDDPYLDHDAAISVVESDDDERESFSSRSGRNVPDRGEVVVLELWIPDAEVDDEFADTGLYHGAIMRLASNGAEGWTVISSKPEPFYGPPSGPYVIAGSYTVPGDVYPLGTLTASNKLMGELNAHLGQMAVSASAYRRAVLVDARANQLAQALASTPDLHIIPVENLDRDRVVPIEVGGITQQQIQYTAMTQDRLDRLTGLNEVLRGHVSGDATATEVTTAATSSGLRIAWMQRCFAEAIDQMMYVVGWYLYHGDEIEIPLGKEAGAGIDSATTFKGGIYDESYDAYSIRVSTYSMERSSEALQQKRALELMQLVMQVGQAMPSMPFVRWDRLLELIGDQLNMPQLKEIIRQAPPQQMSPPNAGVSGASSPGAPADVGALLGSAMRGVGGGSGRGAAGR